MKIIFPSEVYKRLRTYVLAVDTEISFLGKADLKKDVITVSDIALLQQQVTYGSTVLDADAMGNFYIQRMEMGEDPSPWKVWIHSHAGMETIFSTKDEETIESFDLERPDDNWFLSICVNHAGSLNARIDVFSPIRYTIQDVEWDIAFEDPVLSQEIQKEIAEKVTEVIRGWYDKVNWREVLERMKKRNTPVNILLPQKAD